MIARLHQLATINLYALLLTAGIAPLVHRATTAGVVSLRPIDGLLITFAGLMLLIWLTDRRLPPIQSPLAIVLLLFALWMFSSLINTQYLLLTVRRIGRIWLLLILVFGVQTLQPSLKRISQFLAAHALLQSGVAIGQFLLGRGLNLRWLGELELGENVLRIGDDIVLRAQGLTEHPNLLAILLVTSLFVMLAGLPKVHRWQQVSVIGILLVCSTALFFTFGRAATLGGMIAGGYLFIQLALSPQGIASRRSRQLMLIGTGLLILTLGYTYRDVWLSRLTVGSSALEMLSIWERMVQNQIAVAMVQDYPLFGVGARNAQFLFAYYFEETRSISTVIHSTVLLISAELGLIGGLLWLTILLYPIAYAIRHRKQLTRQQHILTAALAPYLIVDWTSPAAWDAPVGSLLRWLLLAVWLQSITKRKS